MVLHKYLKTKTAPLYANYNFDKAGLERTPSYPEDFTDIFKAVSGDGDAAVDRRVEAEVVVF